MARKELKKTKGSAEPATVTTVSWSIQHTISSRNLEEYEQKRDAITLRLKSQFETVDVLEDVSDEEHELDDEEDEEGEDDDGDTGEELDFDHD